MSAGVGPLAPPARSAGAAALLAALLCCAPAAAAPVGAEGGADPAGERRARPEVLDQRPAGGEQCIVCRQRVHQGGIVEVRYKGRTFFVSETMLAEFEARPERYFRALEAHSGLFDEGAVETPPMRTGWLGFGLYVLAGLVAGATCSYVALDRGLPAWPWFFAGLLLNVLALPAILGRARAAGAPDGSSAGLRKIPTTHAPLPCDHCGASNHPAAAACSRCGHALRPTVEPETARA